MAVMATLMICSLEIRTALAHSPTAPGTGTPATVLSPGIPEEVGMDAGILKAGIEMYRRAIARDEGRGAVLLVARKGKVILHEAVGWRDKEQDLPMQKDTMFRMASNTKPVIATVLAMLADQGKLNFEDPVHHYLPSFDHGQARDITLHHLLTHSSGLRIRPIFFQPLIEKSSDHPEAPSLQLEVARFGAVGPEAPVGGPYQYSNAGYNTLGAVAEVITRQPLDKLLREMLYRPLGMTDSYHHEVADKLDGKLARMGTVYYWREGRWTIGWKPGQPPKYPFVRASGGMISTALDYAAFCQMLLNGGVYDGQRLLSEETIARMIHPHVKVLNRNGVAPEPPEYYGYGWRVRPDGVYHHGGSDGTAAWIDPERQLVVLVLTQSPSAAGKTLRRRFFELVRLAVETP